MKRKAVWFIGLIAALALGGCVMMPGDGTGSDKVNAIHLLEDFWEAGDLAKDGEQWFKFTVSSAGAYYIHVIFDTLTDLTARVFTPAGSPVGGEAYLWERRNTWYFFREIPESGTYYIKVWPSQYGDSGTYRIGYNRSATAPR
ncbi:MAG: hypothetical protein LBT93_02600 [Treponema sp.]|nr:hypothetical protein [Treponema sp.]